MWLPPIIRGYGLYLGFANTQSQCKKIQMSLILLNRKKGERQRQMNELCKYSEILTEVAKKKLQEYFNTENLPFSDFDFVNSYLIYQTIRDTQNKPNTLIHIPHKEAKHQFYIPTIILLSLYNFVDNYLDNITEFNEGDTLQKGRDRYIINGINNNRAVLIKKDKANSRYPNVPCLLYTSDVPTIYSV